MKRVAAAPARRITSDEAAALVRPGMWLDYGAVLGQPDTFDAALAKRIGALSGVKVRSCLSTRPRAIVEADPEGKHVHWVSLHFSGYDRKKHDSGLSHYMPVNLGEIPDYYRRFIDPVDIVVIKTCPMDADGYFNFSAANLWSRAVIERARCVIVEECVGLPYVLGVETGVHVSEVDFIIEGDHRPAAELANPPPTEVDRAVARRALHLGVLPHVRAAPAGPVGLATGGGRGGRLGRADPADLLWAVLGFHGGGWVF